MPYYRDPVDIRRRHMTSVPYVEMGMGLEPLSGGLERWELLRHLVQLSRGARDTVREPLASLAFSCI